jgi:hypothetical protein
MSQATKPSESAIQHELSRLRAFIDTSDDPIATRIAYAVETAIRWATEETADWDKPLEEAQSEAKILRAELENESAADTGPRGQQPHR